MLPLLVLGTIMTGLLSAETLGYTLLTAEGPAPSPRVDGTIAYDSASQRVLLFGGDDGAAKNDLWAYSLASRSWQQLAPSGAAPAPRFGHTVIFDPVRRRLVLFGGQARGFFSDVWAYDVAANSWTQLAQEQAGPSRRYGHSAIYDAPRNRMVISHGFTDAGRFDDTWAFDLTANSWRNLAPAGIKPLRRCLHHAVYDNTNQTMLLFGGCASGFGPCPLGDLWSFDLTNSSWTEIKGTPTPAPRQYYGISFDEANQRVLLFSGSGPGVTNDTWSYDARARAWSPLSPSNVPAARSRHQATYAADRGNTLYFGGLVTGGSRFGNTNELWVLGPPPATAAPRFSASGVGNSFSGSTGAAAPGEILSIFGTNLGPLNPAVFAFDGDTGRLPTTGSGVSATFNGIEAPLYYAQAGQLNVQVPYELAGAATARIVVTANGVASDPVVLPVAATRPSLFPAIWNQDGSVNGPGNPAPRGSVVVLYATGQGVTVPASPTGGFPTGNVYPVPAVATALLVNGEETELLFRGQAPGTAGLMQINARVPKGAPAEAAVALQVGAAKSEAIRLFVR